MTVYVRTLGELAAQTVDELGRFQDRIVEEIYANLVDESPVATGTLRSNWFVTPGKIGKTKFNENTGKAVGAPTRLNMKKFADNWVNFTIYNNTPYIEIVNNGEGGNDHNANFIQRALAQSL